MLLAIREFIEKNEIVSNQQLAREFSLELSALTPMIDFWIRKGVVNTIEKEKACQIKCWNCHEEQIVYYQYLQTGVTR